MPGEPLTHHLKKFFAADKKYGSGDRKTITSLCYSYYRIGKAMAKKTTEEKIINAVFLCNDEKNNLLEESAPELNEKVSQPLQKKLSLRGITAVDIFPFTNELSEKIDAEKFALSFLKQPLLFLRIRPGRAVKLLEKLTEAKAVFREISTSCIAMPPASKLPEAIRVNKDAVIQDLNSQQVFQYLQQDTVFLSKDVSVWDCCAASGGKSILLYDLLHGHAEPDVSDVRENILHNLHNRFKDAGIKKYHAFVTDLTAKVYTPPAKKYELIICDAPCTGSGTWARTPEQLSFFDEKEISIYAGKQKEIASAALQSLQRGGLFFYITCSVFRKENEDVVEYLKNKFGLHLLSAEYLKGYDDKADTMFTAVFSN